MKDARTYDAEARRALRHYGRHGKLHGVEAVAQIKARQKDYHERLRTELFESRKDILERRKERLEALVRPAFEKLGEDRKRLYEDLLASQRAERAKLRKDQAAGTQRPDLLPGYDHTSQNPGAPLTPQQSAAYVAHARNAAPRQPNAHLTRPEAADHDRPFTPARDPSAIMPGPEMKDPAIDKPIGNQTPQARPHPFLEWALDRPSHTRDFDRDR
jgi:hypothetical protein